MRGSNSESKILTLLERMLEENKNSDDRDDHDTEEFIDTDASLIHKAADAFELLQHLSSRGLSIQELTNAALATSPTRVESSSPSPSSRSRSRRQLLSHDRKKKNEKESRGRPKRRRSSKMMNCQQREQKKQQQVQEQEDQQQHKTPCRSSLVDDGDDQTLYHQTLHSSFGDFHYADSDNENNHRARTTSNRRGKRSETKKPDYSKQRNEEHKRKTKSSRRKLMVEKVESSGRSKHKRNEEQKLKMTTTTKSTRKVMVEKIRSPTPTNEHRRRSRNGSSRNIHKNKPISFVAKQNTTPRKLGKPSSMSRLINLLDTNEGSSSFSGSSSFDISQRDLQSNSSSSNNMNSKSKIDGICSRKAKRRTSKRSIANPKKEVRNSNKNEVRNNATDNSNSPGSGAVWQRRRDERRTDDEMRSPKLTKTNRIDDKRPSETTSNKDKTASPLYSPRRSYIMERCNIHLI